ncbi:hypothetical protein D7006_03970 [Xanthobacter sp. YC-JY1]|nr:hypothetical protein D7006_03970 [Xanthobacter sp. YC-JY1]
MTQPKGSSADHSTWMSRRGERLKMAAMSASPASRAATAASVLATSTSSEMRGWRASRSAISAGRMPLTWLSMATTRTWP